MIGNKASTQQGLYNLRKLGKLGKLFPYFLMCLVTVVALTACGGSTTSTPKTDPNSPAPVIAIKIDPSKGEFNILSQQLSTQQIQDIQIGNDNFKLDNFDVTFLVGNRIQVSADFVNSPRFAGGSKESKELILPIRFEQDARTTAGISSLALPEITEQSFGQASILPHGRVGGLDFEIQHLGEPFNYYVDAYSSKVEVLNDCSSPQFSTYEIRSTADALKLKDCVVLDANITIDGRKDGSNGSIDLSALDNLRVLDGDLLIRDLKFSTNTSLFAGLEGIAGELRLFDVSGDVRGFDKLKDVTGKIEIANSKGKTLGGFSTLEVANELVIGDNTYGGFDSSFFKALKFVELLEISKNSNLVNLSSLTALESVSRLIIKDNSSKEGLSSLVGLENLLSVGKLEITNNAALKSLTALEKLEQSYESTISNNGNLDCSLKVQPSGQPAYLPKFLPASASTGNQVNCAVAPKGDFEFSTQSSIDSFKGIEVIDGNVRIYFGKSGVTNLNALNSLKEIRGSLEIRGEVVNLTGLKNLKLIDGDFSIRLAKGQVSLAPLANLQQITGTLRVFNGLTGNVFMELFRKFRSQAPSTGQLEPNQFFLGGLHIQGCTEGTSAENCKEQLKNIKHPAISTIGFIGKLSNLNELTLIGTAYDTVEFSELENVGTLTLKSNPKLMRLIRQGSESTKNININVGVVISNPNFDCIQSKLKISTGQSEGNKVDCNSALVQDFVISRAENLEDLKDVSVLEGDLTIQVAPDSKITSLAKLSKLKEIRGDLIIGARPDQVSLAPTNRGLNSLAGLEALELVGGQIIIKRNADLSSIAQLTALKQVNGFSDISENSKLDCRTTPVPAFLPANFSQGNLFNCATKNEPYSILPEQSEISVERNGTDLIDINIGDRVAGFSELINLSLDTNPAIESFSFGPNPTQTQAELEFKVSATAPAGSTNLVIRGESAVTKAEVTATIKLNVVANAPVIRSSRLKDNGTSRQVRQGGLVSLELDGQNLINISSMKLTNNSTIDIQGSLSVGVTNTVPTLTFEIPYGATGTVSLELTTDAGTFSFPNEKVEITAITARAGADANLAKGTPDRPFNTVTTALSNAKSGSTVRLLNSRFNAASGETFPLSIPSGVSVEGESRDGVIIEGPATNSGTATVKLAEADGGFGALTKVTIVGGEEGLSVTRGIFSLENVLVKGSSLGLLVEGSAVVEASNVTINQTQGYGIWVNSQANASLNIRDSKVSEASSGIVITSQAGDFDMRNTQVTNNNYFGVLIQTSGTVSIADSSVSDNGLTGITIPSATGTATFTNVKAENNTGNGVEILKGNLSMTGQLSGNTQNQFLDERPARTSADGAVVNLVGTVISGSSCTEGVVTGPHDSGGLKIKNANNRVNCSFEAF